MEKEAIEEEGMVCGSSCQSSGPMTLLRRGGGAGAKVASTRGGGEMLNTCWTCHYYHCHLCHHHSQNNHFHQSHHLCHQHSHQSHHHYQHTRYHLFHQYNQYLLARLVNKHKTGHAPVVSVRTQLVVVGGRRVVLVEVGRVSRGGGRGGGDVLLGGRRG